MIKSLLSLAILPLLLIPVYGSHAEFINEDKKIELKEIASAWVNDDMTNDEYIQVIIELVENRDIVLYTVFNDRIPSISESDFLESTKLSVQNWLYGNIDDRGFVHNLASLAHYGILGIDDPSQILLSVDKPVYYTHDEILLYVDMLGYRIQEYDQGFYVNSYLDGNYNGKHWFDVFYVPVTLDLRDGFSFQTLGNYTFELQYKELTNSTSFQVITSPIQIQLDKSEYYLNDDIFINGTLTNMNQTKDYTITYDIYQNDNMIESGTGGTLNNDGTFEFTIDTDGWNSVNRTITVTAQDNTSAEKSFYYSNAPHMTDEFIFEYLTNNRNIIDSHSEIFADHNSIINTHDGLFNTHDSMMDEHNGIINNYAQIISDHENTIASYNSIIQSHNDIIHRYNQTIMAQNETIESQQLTIDSLVTNFTRMLNHMADINDELYGTSGDR